MRDKQPELIAGSTVALVEGGDEEALANRLRPGLTIWVADGQGNIPQLAAQLAMKSAASRSALVGVLIVLDAEENADNALVTAHEALGKLGILARPAHNTIVHEGGKKIGVFITPDGTSKGSTETLCRSAADPVRSACVDALFGCAPVPATETTARRDKAWVKAFCATLGGQKNLTHALAPKVIDPAHAAFDPLRVFLGAFP
jgi:hypothetical protein